MLLSLLSVGRERRGGLWRGAEVFWELVCRVCRMGLTGMVGSRYVMLVRCAWSWSLRQPTIPFAWSQEFDHWSAFSMCSCGRCLAKSFGSKHLCTKKGSERIEDNDISPWICLQLPGLSWLRSWIAACCMLRGGMMDARVFCNCGGQGPEPIYRLWFSDFVLTSVGGMWQHSSACIYVMYSVQRDRMEWPGGRKGRI